MSKKQTEVRFALIPHAGCVCEQCLMVASFGLHYKQRINPHKGKNMRCKCEFMPGVKGQTAFEGHDPSLYREQMNISADIRKKTGLNSYEIKTALYEAGVTNLSDVNVASFANEWNAIKSEMDGLASVSAVAREMANRKQVWMKPPRDVIDVVKAGSATTADQFINGVLKGSPMTFDEADHMNVNPNYDKNFAYTVNCQSSVVVYEMRVRGFDVEVLPFNKNSVMNDLAADTSLAWIDPSTGKKPNITRNYEALTPRKFLKFMEETIGDYERYTLDFDNKYGMGHIVIAQRDDFGNLFIYDPQNGKIHEGADVLEYCKRFAFKHKEYGLTVATPPGLLRVDNLDINKEVVEQILKGKP